MRPKIAVYRPRRGTWALLGFLALLVALSALSWFFDPQPTWVRLLGALAVITWIATLAGIGRARLVLDEDTIELFGPAFDARPAPGNRWLEGTLLLFVALDVLALAGGLPLPVRRLELALRLGWLGLYLAALLRRLESGRVTIPYTAIERPPFADAQGGTLVPQQALYLQVAGEAVPFRFPFWVARSDYAEIAGRVAARVRHARAGEHETR